MFLCYVLNRKGSVEAESVSSFDSTETTETDLYNSLNNSDDEVKNITRMIASKAGYSACGVSIGSEILNFSCDAVRTILIQGMFFLDFLLGTYSRILHISQGCGAPRLKGRMALKVF